LFRSAHAANTSLAKNKQAEVEEDVVDCENRELFGSRKDGILRWYAAFGEPLGG
jgi:hypothetical protein